MKKRKNGADWHRKNRVAVFRAFGKNSHLGEKMIKLFIRK
jgi:hypothetical protein